MAKSQMEIDLDKVIESYRAANDAWDNEFNGTRRLQEFQESAEQARANFLKKYDKK